MKLTRLMERHTNCSNTVVLAWLKIQQGWSGHKPEYKSAMMLKECPAVRQKDTKTQTHKYTNIQMNKFTCAQIQVEDRWVDKKKVYCVLCVLLCVLCVKYIMCYVHCYVHCVLWVLCLMCIGMCIVF